MAYSGVWTKLASKSPRVTAPLASWLTHPAFSDGDGVRLNSF